MDESRAAVAAEWEKYRLAQTATRRTSFLGLLAVLTLAGVLIYFAVKCLAHTASVPINGDSINWQEVNRESVRRNR